MAPGDRAQSATGTGPGATAVPVGIVSVGVALLVPVWAHALLGLGGPASAAVFESWLPTGVLTVAAAACLWRAATVPDQRLAAGLLGAGLLSFGAGNTIYALAPDPGAVPQPSWSDPFWLAIYPLEYAALLVLVRRRVGPTPLANRLDGLVGGLATASVMACVTIPAAEVGDPGAPLAERATLLAYPVADLVLLGVVISAVGLAGWRLDRTWAVLAASTVLWETADVTFLLDVSWLAPAADALIATGALGMAVALAVPPGRRARPATADDPGLTTGDRGLLVPVGFGMLALSVLVVGYPVRITGVAVGLACGCLLLALVRMAVALRENQRLLRASRLESTTDALTGLFNRRQLGTDLDAALALGPQSPPRLLVMLDLNGFKGYNDTFGHGAGDRMLAQLAAGLARSVDGLGRAYRMGGDEFCVLAPLPGGADPAALAARCADALAGHGDGWAVSAAYGTVVLPAEYPEADGALALADERMYRDKRATRPAEPRRASPNPTAQAVPVAPAAPVAPPERESARTG